MSSQGHLRRLFAGATWSAADQGLRAVLAVGILLLFARYLGPAAFGVLTFVMAAIRICLVAATLGMERTLVRRLVIDPAAARSNLELAVRMRTLAGIGLHFALVLALAFSPAASEIFPLALTWGFVLWLQGVESLDCHLQASGRLGASALVKSCAALVGAGAKLAAALLVAPLWVFGLCEVLERVVLSILLLVTAWSSLEVSDEPASPSPKSIFRESLPLLLGSVAVILNNRIGPLLLGLLSEAREVGLFSAAIQVTDVFALLPVSLAPALLPFMIQSKLDDLYTYHRRLAILFQGMAIVSLLLAALLTCFAPTLIRWLFGSEFALSADLLRLLSWALVFIFLGIAQGIWDVVEGELWLAMLRSLASVLCNAGLNLWLVPRHGAMGAAIATLLSHLLSTTLLLCWHRRTWPALRLQLESLLLMPLWRAFRPADRALLLADLARARKAVLGR